MTSYVIIFARVPTSTTLSPSPTNAACSGERWAEARAAPGGLTILATALPQPMAAYRTSVV